MSIFYEINLRNLLYVIKKSIIMFHIGIKKVSRPHQKPENPLFMRLPGFLFTIRTLFPIRCKSCFTLLFLAKTYHFDAFLFLVYMVSKLVYPNCTQDTILPKVVTCHNFLRKSTLSQLATHCVANSELPLHHDHIITIWVMIS